MNNICVFAVIAMRDVNFYLALASRLKIINKNYKICFISFYEPGNALIQNENYQLYNLYDYLNSNNNKSTENYDSVSDYSIDELHKYILHEKLTFSLHDEYKLFKKLKLYLDTINDILSDISRHYYPNKIIIFQELGGFIAPLSLYLTATKRNIQHIFFEPSFFNGKIFFNINTLNAPIINETENSTEIANKVKHYLDKFIEQNKAITPKKDSHHFIAMGFSKLVNPRNARQLYYKIYHKYILRKKQEYHYIYKYMDTFWKRYLNYYNLKSLYTKYLPNKKEKFVYFPFHVPLDFALTIRSPDYLNQISFLHTFIKVLPNDFKLYIKEHPAAVGCFAYSELEDLLKNERIILLEPSISSNEVIKHATVIITINSKVGAEAILYGKPVVVFGDSFYSKSNLVYYSNNITAAKKYFNDKLYLAYENPEQNKILEFFTNLFRKSCKGELYELTPENINNFSAEINNLYL
jgi:capsule polysaccharide modification protein KpsS